MKEKLAGMLAVTVLFVLSAGCNAGGGAPAGTPSASNGAPSGKVTEKVEVNYYTWHDEDVYAEPIVEAFNQMSDDTHVNYVSYPSTNDEYYDKMLVMLAAKEPIDLLGINGAPWYANYTGQNVLLGLNDLIEANHFDITPYGTLFTQYALDGEYYALPHRRTMYMLGYNKGLFDEKGLPAPDGLTWREFCDLAKTLTDEEAGVYGCWPSIARWSWMVPACQTGETLLDDDLSQLRTSLETLGRLYNVDHSAIGFAEELTIDTVGMISMFTQGKVAMVPLMDAMFSMIDANIAAGDEINWQIAALPVPDGVESGVTVGQGTFTGITSYSDKQQNAFEFLSYLCGEEGAKVIAGTGTLPAYTSDGISAEFKNACDGKESIDQMFQWKSNLELPVHPKIGEVRSAMEEEVHLYFLGEQSLDDCMAHIYERRSQILGN